MSRRRRRRSSDTGSTIAVIALIVLALIGTEDGGQWLIYGIAGLGGVGIIYGFARFARNASSYALGREPAVYDIDQLRALSPTEFEHKTAKMMRRAGFTHVRVHGGAGDLQADVTGIAPNGKYTVCQVKRYSATNRVTSGEVQSFIGMVYVHHARVNNLDPSEIAGMYVTTGEYTRDARRLGEQHDIVLVDAHGILHGIHDEVRAAGLHRPAAARAS